MKVAEYIENVEIKMTLFRLFNPNIIKYDKLAHVNIQNILNNKTSTCIKTR